MQVKPRNFTERAQYLWVDLPDSNQKLAAANPISEPALLQHFATEGFAITNSAVPQADIAAFLTELHQVLEHPAIGIEMTYRDENREKRQEPASRINLDKPRAKVLDLHARLESTHRLIFAPPILAFLRDIFDDEPVAFQTLYFEYGSQQAAHQDTAYTPVDPPFQMVASWIALEDISPDSGELFFYPRSHSFGEVLFANGKKTMDPNDPDAREYSKRLETFARAAGLERHRFQPKCGDVLYWINDLIHGGEPSKVHKTRRSLVTHYCPLRASVPWAQARWQVPQPTAAGGYILSAS